MLSFRPPQLSSHPGSVPTPTAVAAALTPSPSLPTQLISSSGSSGSPSRASTPLPPTQSQTQSTLAQSLAVNVPNPFKGLRKRLEGTSKTNVESVGSNSGDIEILLECDLGPLDLPPERTASSQIGNLKDLEGFDVVGNAWTGELWCVAWGEEGAKVFSSHRTFSGANV